jgi:hypothetical protein
MYVILAIAERGLTDHRADGSIRRVNARNKVARVA